MRACVERPYPHGISVYLARAQLHAHVCRSPFCTSVMTRSRCRPRSPFVPVPIRVPASACAYAYDAEDAREAEDAYEYEDACANACEAECAYIYTRAHKNAHMHMNAQAIMLCTHGRMGAYVVYVVHRTKYACTRARPRCMHADCACTYIWAPCGCALRRFRLCRSVCACVCVCVRVSVSAWASACCATE